jgi:protein subunit release factor A
VGKPELSTFGGSRDAVQQQLKQLNKEAEALAADLATARNAWLSNREDSALKVVYDDVKAMRAQLDKMREGLQAKLKPGEQYAYYQVVVSFLQFRTCVATRC